MALLALLCNDIWKHDRVIVCITYYVKFIFDEKGSMSSIHDHAKKSFTWFQKNIQCYYHSKLTSQSVLINCFEIKEVSKSLDLKVIGISFLIWYLIRIREMKIENQLQSNYLLFYFFMHKLHKKCSEIQRNKRTLRTLFTVNAKGSISSIIRKLAISFLLGKVLKMFLWKYVICNQLPRKGASFEISCIHFCCYVKLM